MASPETRQIRDLYDSVGLENWVELLGPDLHYHFGQENQKNENIFQHAVRSLYPLLGDGESILDCGCGWGGPAGLLTAEKGAGVTGVTCSIQQARYLAARYPDIEVIHSDLHEFEPACRYDTALFIESYTHLEEPARVLGNIGGHVDKIVMREHFSLGEDLFVEHWQMRFPSKGRLCRELEEAGFRLDTFENVMPLCATGTAEFWKAGIERIWHKQPFDQHMLLLYGLARSILSDPDAFLSDFGLAQIRAVRA